jgi:hypothetical protein
LLVAVLPRAHAQTLPTPAPLPTGAPLASFLTTDRLFIVPATGCFATLQVTGAGGSGARGNAGGGGARLVVNAWLPGSTTILPSNGGGGVAGGGGGATSVSVPSAGGALLAMAGGGGGALLAMAGGGGGASSAGGFNSSGGGNAGMPQGAGDAGGSFNASASALTGGRGGAQAAARTPPPAAQRPGATYGAFYVGIPPSMSYGISVAQRDRSQAHRLAETACRGRGGNCSLQIEFNDICVAVVEGVRRAPSAFFMTSDPRTYVVRAITLGNAGNPADAERMARDACALRERGGLTCRIVHAECGAR